MARKIGNINKNSTPSISAWNKHLRVESILSILH